ncbi:hypothetical protein D3C86_1667450 [compost metagenome]
MDNFDQTTRSIAVSNDIINKQHLVVRGNKLPGEHNVCNDAFGERRNSFTERIRISEQRFFAAGKNQRHLQLISGGKCHGNTRGFHGNHTGNSSISKSPGKLPSHFHRQHRINLVVEQSIQLQHLIGKDNPFLQNPLFQ